MKKESWQGIKGSLVYEDDKAIIVDETDDIKDTEKLSKQLAENCLLYTSPSPRD